MTDANIKMLVEFARNVAANPCANLLTREARVILEKIKVERKDR